MINLLREFFVKLQINLLILYCQFLKDKVEIVTF